MDDLLYKIAITKIYSVGAKLAKILISYCGGAEAVFKTSKKALLKIPGIGIKTVKHIVDKRSLVLAENELSFVEKHRIQPLFYLDNNYPERLKRYDDCPVMLYYKGNTNLNHHRIVGIVGTRKPTVKGRLICEELIEGLKVYDPVIISGLAYGIDITAHKQCIKNGIDTLGVLGHGLRRIYPLHHRSIAEEMLEQGGLLTEFTSEIGPERENFPMRNRIIAGMCDALIVVETARSGGSMITAEIANTYNKDVFAVPGRLSDKYSVGCNHLIKCHKAALIESSKDIGYIMRWDEMDTEKIIQKKLFIDLSKEERLVTILLAESETLGIDNLSFQTKMNPSKMASILLGLEFKGVVKSLPGKQYMLL